jgi:hypothetical protein
MLLLDSGADRTVISAAVLNALCLAYTQPVDRIGGIVDSVEITTQIQVERDDGQQVTLRGTYAAYLDRNALDISVLGRDVLNNFAVIVDRPANRVLLLHGADGDTIQRGR